MTEEEKEIDFEVLPPESKSDDPGSGLSKLIAVVMDNLVKVPGTNFRVGLDPILGLLPGFGDTGTALVSMLVLIQATGAGVPRIAIARMSLNVLINTVVGAIPVAGDLFSVWFKSNARNYKILKRYSEGKAKASKSDWLFVGLVLIILTAVLITSVVVLFYLLAQIFGVLGRILGDGF